jgi:hypothetical protein
MPADCKFLNSGEEILLYMYGRTSPRLMRRLYFLAGLPDGDPARPPVRRRGRFLVSTKQAIDAWYETSIASSAPEALPPAPPKFNLKKATKAEMRRRLERIADAAAE